MYKRQQYKEMLLPLAEERRNVVNLARMFGYKIKASTPAYVDITIIKRKCIRLDFITFFN